MRLLQYYWIKKKKIRNMNGQRKKKEKNLRI